MQLSLLFNLFTPIYVIQEVRMNGIQTVFFSIKLDGYYL